MPSDDRRARLRSTLFLILLATLPCYCLGLVVLKVGDTARQIPTYTPTTTATSTNIPTIAIPTEYPTLTPSLLPTLTLTPTVTQTPFMTPT